MLRRGTTLWRAYRTGGRHPGAWNAIRTYGPTTARFDPQEEPPHDQPRGVMYAAGSIPTAIVEFFGATRTIERNREAPYICGFRLARGLRLLDLSSQWPTRAGASQAISSGQKVIARMWARAIYAELSVDGLFDPSSMTGRRRRGTDPALHGMAVALFDRATSALPAHPSLNMALTHPGLDAALGDIAERFHYGLID